MPISKHQINLCINQRLRVFLFVCCCFFNKTETFKNNKSINLLCRPNTSNLSAGLNNSHHNKNFDTKHFFFFSQVSIAVLPMLSPRRGDDGDEEVLSLLKLSRAVGCSHFRQILQSPPSQVWAAGGSYCPIFQAGLSVSFLSGVGCRRILLPHTSGRFVNCHWCTLHEVLLFNSPVELS